MIANEARHFQYQRNQWTAFCSAPVAGQKSWNGVAILAKGGDLFAGNDPGEKILLPGMDLPERLTADYATIGASAGPHSMKLWRQNPPLKGVLRNKDLHILPSGCRVLVGGLAICRQRPGTAKGHCFISLEDETGTANLFVPADTFIRLRDVITREPFLLAKGRLQISEGDQPTVFVTDIMPLPGSDPVHAAKSHDFH